MPTATPSLSHTAGYTLLLATLLCSSTAYASARSEMLRTQALFELTDGNYNDALTRLDESIRTDPHDLQSRFYRGVALSRLGDYPRALETLLTIRDQVDGEMPRYWYELGYLHYRQQQLPEAELAFVKSVQLSPADAGGHYYLGLCRYKREAYASAIAPLKKAAELHAEYTPSSAYLRGVSLYHLGRHDEAKTLLTDAAARYPESVYAGAIADLLASGGAQPSQRPVHPLSVRLSAGRDSNVALVVDENSLPAGADAMADTQFQLELDAGYIAHYSERQQIRLAYQFLGNRHASFNSYDIDSHSLGFDWQRNTDFGYLSSYYRYRSVDLGGSAYQSGHLLNGVAGVRHSRGRFSMLNLLLSSLSYADNSMSDRDMSGLSLDYRYLWPIREGAYWYLSAGTGVENAQNSAYSLRQTQAAIGLTQPLWEGEFKGDIDYLFQTYPDSSPAREDEQFRLTLDYSRSLNRHWSLAFTLTQMDHSSTWTSYNYNRNTANLAVRWQR